MLRTNLKSPIQTKRNHPKHLNSERQHNTEWDERCNLHSRQSRLKWTEILLQTLVWSAKFELCVSECQFFKWEIYLKIKKEYTCVHLTMSGKNMVFPTSLLISCIPPQTSVTRLLNRLNLFRKGHTWYLSQPLHKLISPSSWKLFLDDFPFFWFLSSSSRTQVTTVWSLEDYNDDLSHHNLPNFKQL